MYDLKSFYIILELPHDKNIVSKSLLHVEEVGC